MPNRKFAGGFLLIEPLFALLLFAGISGFIASYFVRMSTLYRETHMRLKALTLAQRTLNEIISEKKNIPHRAEELYTIETKKIPIKTTVYLPEKLSHYFHKKYSLIECSVSWKSMGGNTSLIKLTTGYLDA